MIATAVVLAIFLVSFQSVGRLMLMVKFLILDTFVVMVKFLRVAMFVIAFVMLSDLVTLIFSLGPVSFTAKVASIVRTRSIKSSNVPHSR